MNAYRDQYAQLFRNGKDVVLIAISADPDTMQAAWARESQFPFLFASDSGLAVGRAYGAIYSGRGVTLTNRNLFIVGPDGRIAYRAVPFREVDPMSYTDLGQAIARIAPADSSGGVRN
jgi:thioredoxin-dependent peroxiredoxin